jgi:tetratricopeptide (TPR) repeat protein
LVKLTGFKSFIIYWSIIINRKCNQCGAENDISAKFCQNCGAKLKELSKAGLKKAEYLQKNKISSQLILILTTVFAAIIILAIYYENNKALEAKLHEGHNHSENSNANSQSPPPSMKSMEDIKALKDHVAANPSDIKSVIQLGNSYYDVGMYEKAIEFYQKAHKAGTKNTSVLIDLAVCYFNLGELETAKQYMEEALLINPTHKQGLYNLGIVCYNMNQFEQAVSYWEKLVEAHPGSSEANSALDFIQNIKNKENN